MSGTPRQKFSPLPLQEELICRRVREVREELRYSQAEYAEKLALSRDQLASIELARVPLKYAAAARLCEQFNLNQRWLASGHKPRFFWIPISKDVEAIIPPEALFSQAYTQALESVVLTRMADCAGALHCTIHDLDQHANAFAQVTGAATSEAGAITNWISRYVGRMAPFVPAALYPDFFAHMTVACNDFLAKHKIETRPPKQGK